MADNSVANLFREELLMCAVEAALRSSRQPDCILFEGSGGQLPADAWAGPALALAEACFGCLQWCCAGDASGQHGHRIVAQNLYLRLVAKLCHSFHKLRAAVVHDGVPHEGLQQLLLRMQEGYGSGAISLESLRARVLWLLAQHLSLRDERERRLQPDAELPAPETLLGQIQQRLLRANRERRYVHWLESSAERGLAGTEGARLAAPSLHDEVGDAVLALHCLQIAGLRSLSHARLCLQVLAEVSGARHASPLTRLQVLPVSATSRVRTHRVIHFISRPP
jgi:hypothetical protein